MNSIEQEATSSSDIMASFGVEPFPSHPDLTIVLSGKTLGNTNYLYGAPPEVYARRLVLAGRAACSEMVAMVPLGTDTFTDIDTIDTDDPRIIHSEEWGFVQEEGETPITDIRCDALITTRKAVGLFLGTADCASQILYDPEAEVLAHVHVGRTGAELDITSTVISYLIDQKGVEPERLIAHFGPVAQPQSYIMPQRGEPLMGSEWDQHVRQVEGGFEVDFVGRSIAQLLEQNVQRHNITTSNADVVSSPEFFSLVDHKTTGAPNGRNGFVAAMTNR